MRQLSLLVTTAILLSSSEARNVLNPKGPPCPEGNGLYAVGCSRHYLQCVNNVEYEQSCPEGLYFDRLMARCERRSANHLCTDSNLKTLNVRQKAVTIDCVGRLSGDYPMDRNVCNENYYQCANGISYMRKCPYNQVYNPVIKRCDYKHTCQSNNGVKQHPAAAYASPTYEADNWVVTTKEFDNGHKGIDCYVLGDMYFTNENQCSPFFWQCANGKLFRKSCPQGLIYVLSQNLCDYPQGVKECPEYDGSEPSYQHTDAPPATTTVRPYVPARPSYEAPVDPAPYVPAPAPPAPTRPAYIPPVTTHAPRYTTSAAAAPTTASYVPAEAPSVPVHSAPIVYNPAVHGDCKEDGFFAFKECHASFLVCFGGHGSVRPCNTDLVFDRRTLSCVYSADCLAPLKQAQPANPYNHGGAYDEKPAEVKVDFDCTGKANGAYFKEACTKNFFRCHDGRAFAAFCPSDLVYNKAIGTCDYAENCEKNYMEPSQIYEQTTKPAPTVGYQAPTIYTTQPPKTEAYTQPPTYTERPTTIYVRPIYTTEPTTVGFEEPQTTQAPYTHAPVTRPTVADDFSCANLIDGDHASGLCNSVFYTCSNNQITATKCSYGLVFNPYQGICDYEQNVRDCAAYQPPQETTTGAYSYMETSTILYAPYQTTKEVTPDYSPESPSTTAVSYTTTQPPQNAAYCERLGNGNYGKPCQTYFFTCYDFETFTMNCPAGLYYDIQNDKCDHKENVEACPEYKPTPTTTPAAEQPQPPKYGYIPDKYPNIDYTTTTPGPVDTTPIAVAFSCYGRNDGLYALPYCSKDFVQCMGGRSLVQACADGLFYAEKTGLCDYKSNVEICQNRKGSDSISSNACYGKADGYYSAGCSSHYFSCQDEQLRKMVCPNKLKFSEKNGKCTYATDVAECSIAKPDNAPPAVPMEFCSIRPSGLHALKVCSPHYVICDNKRAIVGSCASPLAYNTDGKICDYRSNNKECGSDYIAPSPTTTAAYITTTPAQEQPSTSTATPYKPQTTTNGDQYYKSPTTTRIYERPTVTTTYTAPTTTTKAYEAPTTTTTTTTTARPYETVATTTPARDIDVPTTTTVSYKPYEETTTNTPAQDTTTTTAPYVPPSSTAQKPAY